MKINIPLNIMNNLELPPVLSESEERALGIIVRSKEGKERDEAMGKLILHNLPIVIKEARKYQRLTQIDINELFSAGKLGLVVAITRYNPVKFKNNRFTAYALWYVRKEIFEVIKRNNFVFVSESIISYRARMNKLLMQDENLTDEALRMKLNVSKNVFKKIKHLNSINSTSLNHSLTSNDFSDSENILFEEMVADEKSKIPGAEIVKDPRYNALKNAMGTLDERSKYILQSLFEDKDKKKDFKRDWGTPRHYCRGRPTNKNKIIKTT